MRRIISNFIIQGANYCCVSEKFRELALPTSDRILPFAAIAAAAELLKVTHPVCVAAPDPQQPAALAC